MKRVRWLLAAGVAIVAAAAAPAIEEAVRAPGEPPIRAEPAAPRPARFVSSVTPMTERVATLGILNKRNGLSRDLVMKPGAAVLMNDVVVRLKACDQSEPWEKEQLTGAFVQVIVRGGDEKWRKVFSGWLYKETPSLNVVEHPVYDVWVKACTMRHPDIGPGTVVVTGGGGASTARSKAAKSPAASAPAAEPAAESAPSNSTT